jgi:pyrroloquinoline quinone biosynthesis protein D
VSAPPKFRPGVKFRFDETRQAWILLAPEKLFLPDAIAVEILKRVDGRRSSGEIVEELAAAFQAPRDVIERDVTALLGDLAAKGTIAL